MLPLRQAQAIKKSQQQFRASFFSLWVCSVATLCHRGMRGEEFQVAHRADNALYSTRKIECIRKTSFTRQTIGFVIVNCHEQRPK